VHFYHGSQRKARRHCYAAVGPHLESCRAAGQHRENIPGAEEGRRRKSLVEKILHLQSQRQRRRRTHIDVSTACRRILISRKQWRWVTFRAQSFAFEQAHSVIDLAGGTVGQLEALGWRTVGARKWIWRS